MGTLMCSRVHKVLLLGAGGLAALLAGRAMAQDSEARIDISMSELRGTDRMFRTDSRWVGCESAASVKLTDGRILWMFGESRIDPASSGVPENAIRLHNSVALQLGADPETAQLVHFWDESKRRPASFFKEGSGFWYRPVDALEVGSALLILLFKVRPGKGGVESEIAEWSVVRIVNPKESPARWRMQWLPTPANQFGAILGFGGFSQIGGYVITGARIPDEPDELLLVRWSLRRIVRDDFMSPEWWVDGEGWTLQESLADEPSPVTSNLAGSLALSWDHSLGRAVIVASLQDQPDELVVLQAPAPTGPWSEPEKVAELEFDSEFSSSNVSLCKGLRPGETVVSAVPVPTGGSAAAFPRLYRLTTR